LDEFSLPFKNEKLKRSQTEESNKQEVDKNEQTNTNSVELNNQMNNLTTKTKGRPKKVVVSESFKRNLNENNEINSRHKLDKISKNEKLVKENNTNNNQVNNDE